MADFTNAFQITMKNEDGYANNPNDHGGETYAGIAHNFWPSWEGWSAVHAIKAQKPASLNTALAHNSSLQLSVQAFYKANFWNTLSLDKLNSQQTANQLFDSAVNMGVATAAGFLQEAVNALAPGTLTVDRNIGPKTIAAANSAGNEALYSEISKLRKQRYLAIIAANPSQSQFERAWLSRLIPFNKALIS